MAEQLLASQPARRPAPLRPLGPAASVPPITSEVPGSFAWGVLHQRHPKLIDQVAHAHPYPPQLQRALDSLLVEITDGKTRSLPESAPDRSAWDAWAGDYRGQPWDAVPFLWAECYFYRKLLDAVDFFAPGPWFWVDPFEPTKAAELRSAQLDADIAALDELAELAPDDRAQAVLLGAVWGNQADLGFRITAAGDGKNPERQHLIHDDSAAVWSHLDAQPGKIVIIADNAGSELLADLVLVDHLLTTGTASEITIHVKPLPYYVSDAVTTDLIACLRRLAESQGYGRAVADRLRHALRDGRFTLATHPFYCQPWSFHYMPADLADDLATARLVIAKGDLNYRRLVGDLHWPATAPFADATAYFPAPVLSLRILKSDVVLGIDGATVANLEAVSPSWRTSGTYALTEARL